MLSKLIALDILEDNKSNIPEDIQAEAEDSWVGYFQ